MKKLNNLKKTYKKSKSNFFIILLLNILILISNFNKLFLIINFYVLFKLPISLLLK
jgi:hypothetical protein